MKDLNLLVWITQLGISVCAPLGGFTLIGVWLSKTLHTGPWLVALCIVIGLISAADSFIRTLKLLDRAERRKDPKASSAGYNKHE